MLKKLSILLLISTLLFSIGILPTTFSNTANAQNEPIIIEDRSGPRKPSLQNTGFGIGGGNTSSSTYLKNNSVQSGQITGYTRHGLAQAIGRDGGKGVASWAINSAVKNPTKITNKSNGTTRYENSNAVVVLNQNGKVVTTWAKTRQAWR